MLATFTSKESVVKQTTDWAAYKSLFIVCAGYAQVIFSQCLPTRAIIALGAGVSWRFGEVMTDDKYGGSIYHTGRTTELNGKTMNTAYPLYIYGIM